MYQKLYGESKLKQDRVKKCHEKHKLDEFRTHTNSLDQRDRFFIPKISNASRKLARKKLNSTSIGKRSHKDALYEDAAIRRKAVRERTKHKKNIQAKPHSLPQSRKILLMNVLNKVDATCLQLGIDDADDAKIQYDQYLLVIKSLIFYDQDNEAKISENREVFEGWRAMKGDIQGYVTRSDLKLFMVKVLNLEPQNNASIKEQSSMNNSKSGVDPKCENVSVHHSTIDLLKAKESEVPLDLLEDPSSMSTIQRLYKNIKTEKSRPRIPVKKSMKNFFSLKLQENQQKYNKRKCLEESRELSTNKSKALS